MCAITKFYSRFIFIYSYVTLKIHFRHCSRLKLKENWKLVNSFIDMCLKIILIKFSSMKINGYLRDTVEAMKIEKRMTVLFVILILMGQNVYCSLN